MITVAKKNGDYASVQAAVDAVAAKYEALTDEEKEAWQGETIHIAVGVYEEQVEVHVPKLHLIGENLVSKSLGEFCRGLVIEKYFNMRDYRHKALDYLRRTKEMEPIKRIFPDQLWIGD